eukprot:gene5384-10771_t
MPQRHSKNAGDSACYRYSEKSEMGSLRQRLGTDSQLPFGYCCLSLQPVVDPVISPSGHMYSREAIVEYLLAKTQEIKLQMKLYETNQLQIQKEQQMKSIEEQESIQQSFAETQEGVGQVVKRKASNIEDNQSYMSSRKRIIDDTDRQTKLAELKQISPWVPQFTPEAKASDVKLPPKRPSSPMSGQPLRTKDLIPINLEREVTGSGESSSNGNAGAVRFICPISRKTITTQKVILIKTTGALMLESTAQKVAYKSMLCPQTGRPFRMEDVLELVNAASGFAASGQVEASQVQNTPYED